MIQSNPAELFLSDSKENVSPTLFEGNRCRSMEGVGRCKTAVNSTTAVEMRIENEDILRGTAYDASQRPVEEQPLN